MQFHEVANLFPMMSEDEFKSLVEDIKQNGQREPIWIHQNQIIDGRNRFKACQQLGITPNTRQWNENGSLISFVVSLNLHRRHLTESQRGMLGAKLKPMFEDEAKERQRLAGGDRKSEEAKSVSANLREAMHYPIKSSEQAAKAVNVSPRTVESASKVIDRGAPELVQAVETGRIAVSTAATIADAPKEQQREIVAKGEKEILAAAKVIKDDRAQERKQRHFEKQREAIEAAVTVEKTWTITAAQEVVKCHALITDPPYGILNEEWEPDDLEGFTREWATRWNECEADTILIFWSQRHLWSGRRWFDESLSNYELKQVLVWHYPNNKKPQSREMFKQTWEPAYYYRKKGTDRKIENSALEWGDGLNEFDCHVAATPQSNFNAAEMKCHPAQKPVNVFRWLINVTTKPGEIVCDPFAGSGTSGIAAKQLNRLYHGIEINEDYRKLCEGRIAAYGN